MTSVSDVQLIHHLQCVSIQKQRACHDLPRCQAHLAGNHSTMNMICQSNRPPSP